MTVFVPVEKEHSFYVNIEVELVNDLYCFRMKFKSALSSRVVTVDRLMIAEQIEN